MLIQQSILDTFVSRWKYEQLTTALLELLNVRTILKRSDHLTPDRNAGGSSNVCLQASRVFRLIYRRFTVQKP